MTEPGETMMERLFHDAALCAPQGRRQAGEKGEDYPMMTISLVLGAEVR